MTASCYVSQDGLVAGHAYSLLGVNESTQRIILRNPWGNEMYTGPGSDQTNDGIFEVPVDTFKTSFPWFVILMYDNWYKTQLGISSLGPN